jgi:hypothetical protein
MNSDPKDFTAKAIFQENIKALAQYLYVLRGCPEGRALDHWIEAERQLKNCLFLDPIDLSI